MCTTPCFHVEKSVIGVKEMRTEKRVHDLVAIMICLVRCVVVINFFTWPLTSASHLKSGFEFPETMCNKIDMDDIFSMLKILVYI